MNLKAQSPLNFNKTNIECEDKWIAYQMNEDSSYLFGFIYIDEQAGLTFNYEGEFKIDYKGTFVPSRLINANLKSRLEPNNNAIAIIPDEKFKELLISKTPDWLKHYKENEHTIERLYKWGFMYNAWNNCGKALEYLEKAKKINPDFKGLKVELAFSYNCLGKYEDAVDILNEALKIEPQNSYVNKELIFSQVKLKQVDVAEASFRKALKVCEDKTYNAENVFQIVQGYFSMGDKQNFERILNEFENLLNTDSRFPPLVEKMKAVIK